MGFRSQEVSVRRDGTEQSVPREIFMEKEVALGEEEDAPSLELNDHQNGTNCAYDDDEGPQESANSCPDV